MKTCTEGGHAPRLLLIEDDAAQCRVLASIFRADGFDVVCCPTAKEAEKRFQGGGIDVAVVDLRLPDRSESEWLQNLETLAKDVPLVVHTGHGSYETAKRSVNLGAAAYMEKAGDPAELLRAIHKALAAKMRRRTAELEDVVAERTRALNATVHRLRREIEERTRTEEALRRREAELAHVGRLHAVDAMAAGLIHQLSQPLYAISNYVGGARRQLKSRNRPLDCGRLSEAMDEVAHEVRRVGEIVGHFREFLRRRETRRSSIDVRELLCRTAALMQTFARERNVALELPPAGPPVVIQADCVQIEQVLVNLVTNAIEAVRSLPEERRRVAISMRVADEQAVEIAVRDFGPGVAEHLRKNLFEPFVTTKREGLGLGLAISGAIVRAHGGDIWWAHHEPYGAVFYFTLPFDTTERRRIDDRR